MLLKLIEEKKPVDTVVFYNTGMEFNSIYKIRDQVKPILERHNIQFVELQPQMPFLYSALERKIKYRNQDGYHYGFGWCGGPCRWGTREKLNAIARYKHSLNDTYVDYVGIAADETARFEKEKGEGKILPLVEWGMTEADCLEYCHSNGFHWTERCGDTEIDLYDILDRVSCWCCANKNIKELRAMYWELPQYWARLRELQCKIEHPMKGNGQSVFQLEQRFILEKQWQDQGKSITSRDFYRELKS